MINNTAESSCRPKFVSVVKVSERPGPAILGRRQRCNVLLSQLVDATLMVLALWLGHLLRRTLGEQFPFIPEVGSFNIFLWLTLTMPFGPLLLDLHGFYKFPLQKSVLKSVAQITQSLLWLGALIAVSAIIFKFDIRSRAVMIFFGMISTVLLLIKDRIIVSYLRSRAASEEYREKVIVVGSMQEIEQFLAGVTEEQLAQIEIIETIDISIQPTSEVVRALHQHSVGRVFFATSRKQLKAIEEAIGACEVEGVETWLVADFIRTSIANPVFDTFGTQPMLVFRSTPDRFWSLLIKRAMDLFAALFGLVALAPLMIIVAIAIKVTSPGPILFSQMRAGKHGKPFRMYKFRSMCSNAEKRREELEADNQMSGPVFKIDNEPEALAKGAVAR